MSFPPRKEARSSTGGQERPMLPPIRHLFRDELSGYSNVPIEPPAVTLARLRVSDSDDYPHHYRPAGYHVDSPQPPHHSRPTSSRFPQDDTGSYGLVKSRSWSNSPAGMPSQLPSASHDHYYPHPPQQQYRRTVSTDDSYYDVRAIRRPAQEPSHVPRSFNAIRSEPGDFRGLPRWTGQDDDDVTPSAPSFDGNMAAQSANNAGPSSSMAPSHPVSKYECTYCGKGFNRPSSLKIHLNSHTGEKPFVCPVSSCGRGFSVLSNMRRHARMHSTGQQHPDASSDDGTGSERHSSPQLHSAAIPSYGFPRGPTPYGRPSAVTDQSHRRQGSSASASSSSSRHSRSMSSGDE